MDGWQRINIQVNVEPTGADPLDVIPKGGRLDPWCQVSEEEEEADPGNSVKRRQQSSAD